MNCLLLNTPCCAPAPSLSFLASLPAEELVLHVSPAGHVPASFDEPPSSRAALSRCSSARDSSGPLFSCSSLRCCFCRSLRFGDAEMSVPAAHNGHAARPAQTKPTSYPWMRELQVWMSSVWDKHCFMSADVLHGLSGSVGGDAGSHDVEVWRSRFSRVSLPTSPTASTSGCEHRQASKRRPARVLHPVLPIPPHPSS